MTKHPGKWFLAAGGAAALGATVLYLLQPREAAPSPARAAALDAPSLRIVASPIAVERTLHATDAGGKPLLPIRPVVDQAIDFTAPLAFDERMEILHSHNAGLTQPQIERFAAFVRDHRRPEDLSWEELRALKNDILNLLSRQEAFRDQLIALLRALHEDPAQDAGMRNYALQFLAGLSEEKRPDYSLHWRAVEAGDHSLAATALLHLLAASSDKEFTETDRRKLADAAFQMAADPHIPTTSRATALQVCGRLGENRALTVALAIARDDVEAFPLRMAAVATLGDLAAAEASIKDFLKRLATGREVRLRVPAVSALQRLEDSKS